MDQSWAPATCNNRKNWATTDTDIQQRTTDNIDDQQGHPTIYSQHLTTDTCGIIYRPSLRENKPKTLVFNHWPWAFRACFRENWVYKFGHWQPTTIKYHQQMQPTINTNTRQESHTNFVLHIRGFNVQDHSELEFLKSLLGLGTEEE